MNMLDADFRSQFYSGLIASPIDPAAFYCECGNQHHECCCDSLPTYSEVRDHPSLYRSGVGR